MTLFRTYLLGIFTGMTLHAFFVAYFEKKDGVLEAKMAQKEAYLTLESARKLLLNCEIRYMKIDKLNGYYHQTCTKKNRRVIR